jgi:hypothetical protein
MRALEQVADPHNAAYQVSRRLRAGGRSRQGAGKHALSKQSPTCPRNVSQRVYLAAPASIRYEAQQVSGRHLRLS